jgi:hypothetical protein
MPEIPALASNSITSSEHEATGLIVTPSISTDYVSVRRVAYSSLTMGVLLLSIQPVS